jgi:hypothetical protein
MLLLIFVILFVSPNLLEQLAEERHTPLPCSFLELVPEELVPQIES